MQLSYLTKVIRCPFCGKVRTHWEGEWGPYLTVYYASSSRAAFCKCLNCGDKLEKLSTFKNNNVIIWYRLADRVYGVLPRAKSYIDLFPL